MNRCPHATAFSLVEVTLALGIMAFCLIALFGLLPIGLNSNQTAIEQTAAAGVASVVAADLRQTPLAIASASAPPTSPRFFIPVPAKSGDTLTHTMFFTEDGTAATATPTATIVDRDAVPAQAPRCRATLTFALPATPGTDRTATSVRLLITWPALADGNASAAPSHYTGSFETVIALDRN